MHPSADDVTQHAHLSLERSKTAAKWPGQSAVTLLCSPTKNVSNDRSNEKQKILVVDDEPNILGLLEQSLNDHEVTKARNAAEAIRQLDSHAFKLTQCCANIVMPEQSGFVVYVAAKNTAKPPSICLYDRRDTFRIKKAISLNSWQCLVC